MKSIRSKKNNEKKTRIKWLLPEKLWTGSFTYWWIISLITVFLFDIFWMLQTTFRPMSYYVFYPVLFLSAFVLALPSLLSRNGIIQTIWLLLFDTLFIANLMYCRTYYNAIPFHSYALIGNLADFTSSVADSFKWYFAFLPAISIVGLIVYVFNNTIKKMLPSVALYLINVVILGIMTWAGDAWRGGMLNRMEFMSGFAYLSSSVVPIYSLGGYLVHDYYKTSEKLKPEDEEYVGRWLDYHKTLTERYVNDSTRNGRKIPENLVIILCESLESWVLEKEIEGKEVTPNLNRLLADSTTFYAQNVVTQVGSGRSIEGQLLTLTGLMPMHNKVYAYEAVENKYFTIAKAFKDKGAETFIFTPDKPYVWNQGRVAPSFGFDRLIDERDFKIDETTGRTKRLSDGSLMKQITKKIENRDVNIAHKTFMILIVTNSGHNPFNLPQHLRTIEFTKDYPRIIKDYMTTAHYTDAAIQTFIDYLKTRPDWEDTMVVITGDHEGLATDRREALDNSLSREFVDPMPHTPLIILNSPVVGRYDKQLGQADIYSTLIDLLRLDDYAWKGVGMSVLDADHPGVAIGSDGGVLGDTVSVDPELLLHLKDAPKVSELILKFDLLKNYPDSI